MCVHGVNVIDWLARVELPHKRSSCHGSRLVSYVELSQGASCHEDRVVSWVEFFVGRVVIWVEMT